MNIAIEHLWEDTLALHIDGETLIVPLNEIEPPSDEDERGKDHASRAPDTDRD